MLFTPFDTNYHPFTEDWDADIIVEEPSVTVSQLAATMQQAPPPPAPTPQVIEVPEVKTTPPQQPEVSDEFVVVGKGKKKKGGKGSPRKETVKLDEDDFVIIGM